MATYKNHLENKIVELRNKNADQTIIDFVKQLLKKTISQVLNAHITKEYFDKTF